MGTSKIKSLIIMLTVAMSVKTYASESANIKSKTSYKCEIKSGKNVASDFRNGSQSGVIKGDVTGKAVLTISPATNLNGLVDIKVETELGKPALYATTKKVHMNDSYFNATNEIGNGVRLKRVYKNEWYGSIIYSEFQDEKHVVFLNPIKCIID